MKKTQLEEAEQRKLQYAKAELELKQNILQSQQRQQEKQQDEKEYHRLQYIQEQKDRMALANKLFSNIDLTPKFYLSRTVAQSGAKMEVRGQNWDEIKRLHESKEWLALISLLLDQEYNDYPEAVAIEDAFRRLNEYNLYVLCRTPLREEGNQRLILLTLRIFDSYNVVDLSHHWETHPDGIGYTHYWSPSCEGGIVLYGDMYVSFRQSTS